MPPSFPAWVKTAEQTAAAHGLSDPSRGLSDAQVEKQREKHGYNELDQEEGKPLWKLVLEQFDDTLVKILLLAAAVSFGLALVEEKAPGEEGSLSHYVEPLVIVLILVLNAIVGVWQESNAESALEALKEMQSDTAKCVRNGALTQIPARELVPGDVVELRVGDKVPADLRLLRLKTATVRVEQASLTGESVAVGKSPEPIGEEDCELQAKENMLFAGTSLSSGQCLGVVNDIGMATELGKIQASITEAKEEEEDTPLKQKLDEFGDLLTKVIGVICLVVWIINYKFFLSWEPYPGTFVPDPSTVVFSFSKCTYYFKIAVALAVAAIPEGLPAVITTCLALGTRKMAKQNAIVRKLPSVETLGCTTVICSDKTGTLTTNQMSAVTLVAAGPRGKALREFVVEGSTFNPSDGGVVGHPGAGGNLDPGLAACAQVCALNNESRVEYKDGAYKLMGEPTEGALKVLAEKLGPATPEGAAAVAGQRKSEGPKACMAANDTYSAALAKVALLEFDRTRKSMSVLVSPTAGGAPPTPSRSTRSAARGGGGGGGNTLLVKGASESVVERCNKVLTPEGDAVALTPALRAEVMDKIHGMSSQALRVLALAVKGPEELGTLATYDGSSDHPAARTLADPNAYMGVESGLTLVGLAGLRDPPRPEVRRSIEECRDAGIRVVVITGDNKLTAEAIAREIAVFRDGEDTAGKSMTGREFAALSRDEQIRCLMSDRGGRVFSRAEPKHKQDIVRLLKDQGEVAAMTGDGVNDAPALQMADIGVAMGIAGTQVAKDASDMVLADDNFSTIVAAVSEGRSIYANMKAFIRYMISSNIGEVMSIFLTAATGMPEGLIPVQLLWVNLVTDGPPATALGFNPPDLDIMKKPPRGANDSLLTTWVLFRYMVVGLYVGAATVGIFGVWYTHTEFMGVDLSGDGHSVVSWHQLTHWGECESWGKGFKVAPFTAGQQTFDYSKSPCEYFGEGKVKASTLSLSVLVAIEMFNALNAISEDGSLLSMPPWVNPYLLVAMCVSFGLHFVILYVPALASIFSIVPLSVEEWKLVLLFSAPVVLLDEVLKFFGRMMNAAEEAERKKQA